MRTINSFILLCVFCLSCQPTLAQRRVRLADLSPFERAVVVVKWQLHFFLFGQPLLKFLLTLFMSCQSPFAKPYLTLKEAEFDK